MLLISYQPVIQRHRAAVLTCPKHDHVTTNNRTLAVNADVSEPNRRARAPERLKALQIDREELPYPTQYHDAANHQVDESAENETRSAFITPSTRRMAHNMRISHVGGPGFREDQRTKYSKNPLDRDARRSVGGDYSVVSDQKLIGCYSLIRCN